MTYLIKHRFIWFIFSILLSVPFVTQLPLIKTVDNVDYFTLDNDPEITFYDEFKKIFGNDEFFIVAFKKQDMFTRENLTLISGITESLEKLEEIREIKSLTNVNTTRGEDDFFIVEKLIETIPDTKEAEEALKIRTLSDPLYLKNLISADGLTTAIIVSVYDRPEDPSYRKRVIEKTLEVLKPYEAQTGKVYLAGWTITNLYLSQYMKKDIRTFIPVTYIFITIAIFLFFRNIRLTLAAVLNISICMGATMGLFPILGIYLNNVTTIVPPVVMALSLCDTVHIFTHLKSDLLEKYPDSQTAMVHVLKQVFWPCLITTLTTAAGFLSLYLSDIPPIKEFSLIASAGMGFEFVFSFLFLPALLLFFDPEKIFDRIKSTGQKTGFNYLAWCSHITVHWAKAITIISVITVCVSLVYAVRIRVETNLLDYFNPKGPVRQAVDFVETQIAGIRTIDIEFSAKETDAFKRPENLALVEQVQQFAKTVQGVDKVLSFVDFLKDMNQAFHNENKKFYSIPDSKEMVSQYLLLYDYEDIDEFVTESYDQTRISIRTHAHLTSEQARIINSIRQYVESIHFNGIDMHVTGRAVLHVNVIDALVKGQLKSLFVATIVIFFFLIMVLKSFKLGALSLIPNFFPIAINFGMMGFFDIPLNTATALISAVAIGIAVDDTIHFLTRYKSLRKDNYGIRQSLDRVIMEKGKAIFLSSLILCIGFGTMIISQFTPTFHFGMLSAIIMITAVIGDMIVLPALLNAYDQLRNN